MTILKRYRTPSFAITVRELTSSELSANANHRRDLFDSRREYLAVDIRAKGDGVLTCLVGSPVVGEWNPERAARSAVSFASERSCWDLPSEREWVEAHGEELSNEAFCHRVLGAEMRA